MSSRSFEKLIDTFDVHDNEGNIYTLKIYQQMTEVCDSSGCSILKGKKIAKTIDGRKANRVDDEKGHFQIITIDGLLDVFKV